MTTTAFFNLSQPIVYVNGTMQPAFADFIRSVDLAITDSGLSAQWGNIGGTLADQVDLQAAIDAAEITATWGSINGTLSDQTDLQAAFDGLEVVVEKTANYTTAGTADHEIVVCNNTSAITITLHTLTANDRVTVIRASTGAVTVDGDGSTIAGNATQSLPSQYDAAELVATSVEWVLL